MACSAKARSLSFAGGEHRREPVLFLVEGVS
jgi:hypothetical protein